MRTIYIILFTAASLFCKSQTVKPEPVDKTTMEVPVLVKTSSKSGCEIHNLAGLNVMPAFPGGISAFYAFFAKNYAKPKQKGLNGNVFVSFVIEADGTLSDMVILRDIGYGTGEETLRVLQLSPQWSPGQIDGVNVCARYSLPIKIKS